MLKYFIIIILSILSTNLKAESFYSEKIKNPNGQFFFENENISQYIEVLYFFSYDCNVCYKSYGHFYIWEEYKKQMYVNFKKIPVGSKALSEMFFLRKAFGYNSRMDNEIYKGLNLGFLKLEDHDDIRKFYEKLGKKTEDINKKLNSEKLNTKINISKNIYDQFKKYQNEDDKFLIVINYENDSYIIKNEKNKSPVDFILSINKTINHISKTTPSNITNSNL